MTRSCTTSVRGWMTAAVLGVISLTVSGTAFASSDESNCSGFLPDFSCDRPARPQHFAAPMTFPYLFEEPFVSTELQLVGIKHDFPERSVFAGGEAGVIALQIRVALTEKLAFIATKDGLTMFRPSLGLLHDTNDFMDMTVGFKYALIEMERDGRTFTLTPHVRYEIPMGANNLFQNNGDGVMIPGVSWGWGANRTHVLGSIGAQLPIDGGANSTSMFYNLQVGYAVTDTFIPFVAVNGMHWTDGGDGMNIVDTSIGNLTLNQVQAALAPNLARTRFEGADIANLGTKDIAGADLVTLALGARAVLSDNVSVGFSYEHAVSSRKDIFEDRMTVMTTYNF